MSRLRRATKRLIREPDFDDEIPQVYDEQEQERIIKDLELEMFNSENQFKLAFTTVQMVPTPVYILLPYCRKYNSMLSLLSLLSIAISIYILQMFNSSIPWLSYDLEKALNHYTKSPNPTQTIALTPLEQYLTPLNILLAAAIMISGYIEHRPWRGYDYVWFLPSLTILITICFRKWVAETHQSLSSLNKSRYPYKGA